MSFRDNLQHLRATRNMTQEQLAMLVGVSRQSVTKWEAEKAYPEMDKLLKLCDIFGCTLDELVKGDLTDVEPPRSELVSPGPATDVCGYDEHVRSFARRMALGVSAIIVGVAVGALLDGVNPAGALADSSALSMLALFAFVALGVALIVPTVMAHTAFQKEHPFVEDFYTPEQRAGARGLMGRGIALGVGAILLGVLLPVLLGDASVWAASMLLCVAVGVGTLVYSLVMGERVNLASYNEDALDELSEDEISEAFEGEELERALAARRGKRRVAAVCTIIMLAATALALVLLFTSIDYNDAVWSPNDFFWLPWAIGGIACAGVAVWERDLRSRH